MTGEQRDSVLPIDDVLARIRACITGSPSETIVSLTVNSGSAGETTVFRLSVQADGRLVSLCAAESVPSSPQSTQLDPSTAPPSSSPQPTAMDDEHRGADDLIGRLNECSGMDLDDGDGAEAQLPSIVEDASDSSSSRPSRVRRERSGVTAPPIAQPPALSKSIPTQRTTAAASRSPLVHGRPACC